MEEFQDGLELSLGLGLSRNNSSNNSKWKNNNTDSGSGGAAGAGVSAPSSSSDLGIAAESASPNASVKPKALPNKAGGLDAALKKFLQGSVDDEDEAGKLLDGSASFAKASNATASGSGLGSDTFHFTEIPVKVKPPVQHPLQFDAFKIEHTPDGSAAAEDSDEQQRILQEAHRKRKNLAEEQKLQKKGKKDEDKHGFRRPDTDRGFESDENDSTGVGHNENTGGGDLSKGSEVTFMPRFHAQDMDMKKSSQTEEDVWQLGLGKDRNVGKGSVKRPVVLPGNNQQEGQLSSLTIGRGEPVGNTLTRDREKVPSETSSTGTDCTDQKEEKTHTGAGDSSGAKPDKSGDKTFLGSSPSSFHPSTVTPNTPPYSLQSFPPVSPPYSVQMPAAAGPGMSIQMNFPYLMQHGASGSDGQEQTTAQQIASSSPFQPSPGIEYPPQLGATEGSSWTVLRPPVMSPFNNSSNGPAYNRNGAGLIGDGNKGAQGTKMHENGSGQNVSMTMDGSTHPFFRPVAQHATQDPVSQLHRTGDVTMMSPMPVPGAQQFGSQHDSAEVRSLKDPAGINSFPGFAQPLHGLQGTVRPSSSGMKDDVGPEQAKFGAKLDTMMQQLHQRNGAEVSNPVQEEFRRALGGQFNQGTTENLVLESLADELPNLRKGVAPNLKFGGTGSAPDLPWVHTTAPNGQTIGGVLYKLNQNQLRIVCACHGKHMTPAEFSQHAAGLDVSN